MALVDVELKTLTIFVYLHETAKFGKSSQIHFKLHREKETKKKKN